MALAVEANSEVAKAKAVVERALVMAAADLGAAEGEVLVVAVALHNHDPYHTGCSHPFRRCICCTSWNRKAVAEGSSPR
jgi:hypothetical protein